MKNFEVENCLYVKEKRMEGLMVIMIVIKVMENINLKEEVDYLEKFHGQSNRKSYRKIHINLLLKKQSQASVHDKLSVRLRKQSSKTKYWMKRN